jgi:hypothetical protein
MKVLGFKEFIDENWTTTKWPGLNYCVDELTLNWSWVFLVESDDWQNELQHDPEKVRK